jgi:8-oxo-dGTP pyrophosphatase MutT (NUDIX family)
VPLLEYQARCSRGGAPSGVRLDCAVLAARCDAPGRVIRACPTSSRALWRALLELVAMVDISETEPRPERRAAMLLIVTDSGLLMHHRDDKPGIANPDCWAGFGGAVEDGETVEEALLREVREETGLVIKDAVFLTDAVDHEGDGRLVSLFYVVGDYQPADIDLHEGAGVAIQRIADLPGLKVTPFVRRAIKSHLLPVLEDHR